MKLYSITFSQKGTENNWAKARQEGNFINPDLKVGVIIKPVDKDFSPLKITRIF